MRFVLALHDVWPGNAALAADYLARLRSLGARRMALLVVPAFHGAPAFDGDAGFLAWLREEAARGTELFLHGYRHLMGERVAGAGEVPRRSAWGRFVNGRLVDREAEFSGLPRAESARLLSEGMASWKRSGLPLSGFVAPTWHGSPAPDDLRAAGVPLRETRFRLDCLPAGRARFVPPLAWDLSRGDGPRLFGGRFWLEAMLRLPLIKVALHPGDFESAATEGILARVFAAGENIGYGEVFGNA